MDPGFHTLAYHMERVHHHHHCLCFKMSEPTQLFERKAPTFIRGFQMVKLIGVCRKFKALPSALAEISTL